MWGKTLRCFRGRIVLAAIAICQLFSLVSYALPPLNPDQGLADAHQALLALQNPRCVMCLAAHPDDEDSATLAYLEKQLGVRTVIVYSTRGEGGQNEIGPELGNELAVIRAQEINDMAALVGAEVENLCAPEFGFSKTATETLSIWDRQELLRRMVMLIRIYQPDIIITHHDTVSGHGHHQATGIIGLEAFEAAADATAFPEQAELGLKPWQPAAFFMRIFNQPPETGEIIGVPVGAYDALRGASYAEIGAVALKRHQSQGRWKQVDKISKQSRTIRYQRVRSAAPEVQGTHSFFDGVDKVIESEDTARRDLMRTITDALQGSQDELLQNRAEVLQKLLQLHSQFDDFSEKDNPFYLRKMDEWNRAVAAVAGLYLETKPEDTNVIFGQDFQLNWSFYNAGGLLPNFELETLQVLPTERWKIISPNPENAKNDSQSIQDKISVRVAQPESPPWAPPAQQTTSWSPANVSKDILRYNSNRRLDALVHSREFGKPNLEVRLRGSADGIPIELTAPLQIKIVPEIEINCTPQKAMVRAGLDTPIMVRCQLQNFAPQGQSVHLQPQESGTWEIEPPYYDVELPSEDAIDTVAFKARPTSPHPEPLLFQVFDENGGLLAQAHVESVPLSVKTAPNLLVGIVRSYDDTLKSALETLGVDYELLDTETLLRGDLSRYTTILIDIRAYLVRDDLRRGNQRILEYVHQGGAAIVFYQKVFEWNASYGNPQFAPYPLQVSHDRVTDERATITMLAPDHPLLSRPNRLGPADWEGWVQERGLYFAGDRSGDYKPLLSAADPGEDPLNSGYLCARYGEGWYVYTAYVWYRQLRAGVPGAYRALANMVSLPRIAE